MQARKALSALKGLVKLQAVVRGELVRRRVVQKTQLNTRAEPRTVPTLLDYLNQSEKRNSLSQREGTKSEELRVSCLSVGVLFLQTTHFFYEFDRKFVEIKDLYVAFVGSISVRHTGHGI